MGSLILRTILGFLFLLAVLGLLLFASAGSFSFWQAWVYLSVFAACVILITFYLYRNDRELLEGRVKAGPAAEQEKSQQVIQSLAGLFFVALFVVAGLDYRFHWSVVPLPLIWISDVMVAVGFFIVFLVFRENTYTRATIEVSEKQSVVTSGPYRVVRHPMYAGALLMLVFSALALGSWLALLCIIALTLAIAIRLLEEEKFLEAHLPGYKEYREQVPYRLIPGIW